VRERYFPPLRKVAEIVDALVAGGCAEKGMAGVVMVTLKGRACEPMQAEARFLFSY
jgi:hypothetical protein